MNKLTLLLLTPLAAYASNATQAANTTATAAATTAAAAAGNATAASTAAAAASTAAAGTAAATQAATAAATKAAAAATKAAAGNATAPAAGDKKVKIAIPAVKVSVDFTIVSTAALKKDAATAIYDGVKVIATAIKAGGTLYAKFDSQFGTAGLPGTTGYAAARRLAATETTNDFKYVVAVPAADHATTMAGAKTAIAAVTADTVGNAIKAQFAAKGNLGNVTVAFDPSGMGVSDPAAAGTSSSSSGAAAVTGFVAMVFAGVASLF